MKALGRTSLCHCLSQHQVERKPTRVDRPDRKHLRPCLQRPRQCSRQQRYATCTASQAGNSSSRSGTIQDPEQAFQEVTGPAPEKRLALLKRIAAFAGPALSIPLADPLMSLIDTISIGQVSAKGRSIWPNFGSIVHHTDKPSWMAWTPEQTAFCLLDTIADSNLTCMLQSNASQNEV